MSSNLRIDGGPSIQLALRYRAYDGWRMIMGRYCNVCVDIISLQSDIFRLFRLNSQREIRSFLQISLGCRSCQALRCHQGATLCPPLPADGLALELSLSTVSLSFFRTRLSKQIEVQFDTKYKSSSVYGWEEGVGMQAWCNGRWLSACSWFSQSSGL